MSDLISREAAVHVLCEENINRPLDSDRWLISDIYKKIEELPTVDAVEVVRCKDCKRWKTVIDRKKAEYGICQSWTLLEVTMSDGFCSKGERRNG